MMMMMMMMMNLGRGEGGLRISTLCTIGKMLTIVNDPLVTAASKAEYDMWVNGLDILVQDTVKSSYPLQVERFVMLFIVSNRY